jgi:hypothetical protein
MSSNKYKYFVVTTTSVVKAPNKAIAQELATSTRKSKIGIPGEMLFRDIDIERITAVEAQSHISA